jgi:hypothetical protein
MFGKHIVLGFSATFFGTVYSTCIGHYIKYGGKRFFGIMKKEIRLIRIDQRKRLIGLHGLLIGIGEVLGKCQLLLRTKFLTRK